MDVPKTIEIQYSQHADLETIATCHKSAFPSSLSTAMGTAYLKKMLEWYLVSPDTFLFFLKVEGQCLGYCGGMVRNRPGRGSASSMAQYTFSSAIIALLLRPWLLFHREVITKYPFIIKNLVDKFVTLKKKDDGAKEYPDPYVGLVVIGVQSASQGRGYSSLLIKEFERKAGELGYSWVRLSVRTENERAIKSYLRNGWQVKGIKGHSTSMEKNLT